MRAIVLFTMLFAGCGLSCQERGGHLEFRYFIPITTMVGKIPVTNLVPVYECVGAIQS